MYLIRGSGARGPGFKYRQSPLYSFVGFWVISIKLIKQIFLKFPSYYKKGNILNCKKR